jgi:hypothetical protein
VPLLVALANTAKLVPLDRPTFTTDAVSWLSLLGTTMAA